MAEWKDEQPTMELRLIRKPPQEDGPWLVHALNDRLQQKWRVARGGAGRGVEYTEEWRDVPTVKD